MRPALFLTIVPMLALPACKPPPTDADMAREMPQAEPTFASDPLPSPDTEGAVWAQSPQALHRIIYGIPGEPALVALDCLEPGSLVPRLQITRISPADEDAGALLALVGNGHIGRIAVDAREVGGRWVWQGEAIAADLLWEPLAGPRQVTLTVPGAGMVTLNPGDLAWDFVVTCRGAPEPIPVPEIEPEIATPELSPIP